MFNLLQFISIILLMLYPSDALNPIGPRAYSPTGADMWKRVCGQTPHGCLGVQMSSGTASDPKHFAVLVDAENARYSSLAPIMEEMATLGAEVIIRRIYGDFTLRHMAQWKQTSLELSFTPRTAFNYVSGKCSADALMIIEAMDLLHNRRVSGFAIVSSDSDFTPLVLRLREERMAVIGFGEKKTPDSFVSACERFVYTENLGRSIDPSTAVGTPSVLDEASASGKQKRKFTPDMLRLVRKVIDGASDEGGWLFLSKFQSLMQAAKADWDVRTYGYKGLKECVAANDDRLELALWGDNSTYCVRWRVKPSLDEPEVDAEFAPKIIKEKDIDNRNAQVTGKIIREKDVGVFDHNSVATRARQLIPLKDLKLNAEVTGKIVGVRISKRKSETLGDVDIGAECNALLRINTTLQHQNNFSIGETVRASIQEVNVEKKYIILNQQRQFRRSLKVGGPVWKSLRKSPKPLKTPLEELHAGATVKGRITKKTPLGVHIDVGASSLAFLPKSQTVCEIGDLQFDQTVEGRILGIDLEKQQFTITCKKCLEELNVGDPVEGQVVKNLSYAYLVDIGVSKLAILFNNCVSIADDGLAVGSKVTGRILNVDLPDKLSITCKEPLEEIQVGTQVVGRIVEVMAYGVFVDIDASVCGLLHKSQVDPPLDTEDITERFTAGEIIQARIQDVDLEKQHVSLTCKQKFKPHVSMDERIKKQTTGHSATQAGTDVPNKAPATFDDEIVLDSEAIASQEISSSVSSRPVLAQAMEEVAYKPLAPGTEEPLDMDTLYETDLARLTVSKLKGLLRERQLLLTGRKTDLVDRLLSALNEERQGGSCKMKDALVMQIKKYQRSGEDAKQNWWSFCDEGFAGERDPALKDAATLRSFIANHVL